MMTSNWYHLSVRNIYLCCLNYPQIRIEPLVPTFQTRAEVVEAFLWISFFPLAFHPMWQLVVSHIFHILPNLLRFSPFWEFLSDSVIFAVLNLSFNPWRHIPSRQPSFKVLLGEAELHSTRSANCIDSWWTFLRYKICKICIESKTGPFMFCKCYAKLWILKFLIGFILIYQHEFMQRQ